LSMPSSTLHRSRLWLEQIVVRVEHGNIKITDATRDGVTRSGRLHFDLQTGKGYVQEPGGSGIRPSGGP
jgi:hypothetical protein